MPRIQALPVVVGVLLAACAPMPGMGTLVDDPSEDIPGLEITLELDPARLAPGDSASVRITMRNTTEREIRVGFPDDRQVALLIRDSSGQVTYTDDRTVAIPTYLSLGTFERWDTTMPWDGQARRASRRLQLPPGRYQVQAGLRRHGVLYVNRSNRVDFEVSPPGD
ncbi:hypothetical protein K8I85_06800 [bacterium]|nr:hypothetical protein [bacterium]